MLRFRYITIVLLLIGILFCCKKKDEKILGNWKYVYLSSVDTGKIQIWTFNEDKSLIVSLNDVDTLLLDTGTWSIKKEMFNGSRLTISSLESRYNGTYEMLTLNKKYLILQRILLENGVAAGAFLRTEFIRK